VLLRGLRRVNVLSIGPYSCRLLRSLLSAYPSQPLHHNKQSFTMQTPYSDLSFTVLKTICSNIRSGASEDGHNDAETY